MTGNTGGSSRRTSGGSSTLKRKLLGHWNYYGIIGNSDQTSSFAWFAKKLVHKWLNRRSQRQSFTVTSFVDAWERWQMPEPRLVEVALPLAAGHDQPRPVSSHPTRFRS